MTYLALRGTSSSFTYATCIELFRLNSYLSIYTHKAYKHYDNKRGNLSVIVRYTHSSGKITPNPPYPR